MKKFLINGISVFAALAVTNAFGEVGGGTLSGGYVCDTAIMKYTACKSGNYLSGNSCVQCPAITSIWENAEEIMAEGDLTDFFDEGWTGGNVLNDVNYSMTPEVTEGFACKKTLIGGWNIEGGQVVSGQTETAATLFCGVVTNEAASSFADTPIGEYVCFGSSANWAVNCDGGYQLASSCMGEQNNTNCNIIDEGMQSAYAVRSLSDLQCSMVEAGYYSPAGDLFAKLCPQDTDGIGKYCPQGAAAPKNCPAASNAVDPETKEAVTVYGVTGVSGATSILSCYLPAGDAWYEDSHGYYTLEASCEFEPNTNPEEMPEVNP